MYIGRNSIKHMPPKEIAQMRAIEARSKKCIKDSIWRREMHERGLVRKDLMRGLSGQTKIEQKDMYHMFRKVMCRDHPSVPPTLSNFFHVINPEVNLSNQQERDMYFKLWDATVRDNDLREIDMIMFTWTTDKVFGNLHQEEQAHRAQLKDEGMSNEDLVKLGLYTAPEIQSNTFKNRWGDDYHRVLKEILEMPKYKHASKGIIPESLTIAEFHKIEADFLKKVRNTVLESQQGFKFMIKRFPGSAGSGPGSQLQQKDSELQESNNMLVINMDPTVDWADLVMTDETREAMVLIIGMQSQTDDNRTHNRSFNAWVLKYKLAPTIETTVWKHFRDEKAEYIEINAKYKDPNATVADYSTIYDALQFIAREGKVIIVDTLNLELSREDKDKIQEMIDPMDSESWYKHARYAAGIPYHQEVRPLFDSKMPPVEIIERRIALRVQRLKDNYEKVENGTAKQIDYDNIDIDTHYINHAGPGLIEEAKKPQFIDDWKKQTIRQRERSRHRAAQILRRSSRRASKRDLHPAGQRMYGTKASYVGRT